MTDIRRGPCSREQDVSAEFALDGIETLAGTLTRDQREKLIIELVLDGDVADLRVGPSTGVENTLADIAQQAEVDTLRRDVKL